MLALLLSGALSLFLFTGFGFFVSRVLNTGHSATVKLLIGLVTVNTLTAVCSLLLPVNIYLLTGLCLIAALLMYFVWEDIKTAISDLAADPANAIVSILFIIPAVLIALNAPDNYDTGLYHTQAIKWIEEYPIVPGLANLHGRFGFNPNVFCLFALTSLSGFFGQHIYSVNLTVFIILVPWFINHLRQLYSRQGVSGTFLFLAGLFLTLILLTGNLTSPSPDMVSLALTLYIFAGLAVITAEGSQPTFSSYLPLLIISVYVITVKLSTAPVLLLPLLLFLKHRPKPGQWVGVVAIAAFIVLPWLIRNVVLSGWLVYPLPGADLFSFDWKVPFEKVYREHESVTGWARNPGPQYAAAAHMGVTGWLPLWLAQFKWYEKLFIAAGSLLPVMVLASQALKTLRRGYLINCIVLTALAGCLFWLFTAPVFRFGIAFIVVGLLSPLLIVRLKAAGFIKPVLLFNLLIVLLFCAETLRARSYIKNSVYSMSRLLVKPATLLPPAGSTITQHQVDGIIIYEPLPGDQCFDHGLPCTPYPDKHMKLRGKTITSGFKIIAPKRQ